MNKKSILFLNLVLLLSGISYAKDFKISDSSSTFLFLNATSGFLGLGALNPSQKLDVAGTARLTNLTLSTNCADGEVLKWSGGVGKCGVDLSGDGLGNWSLDKPNYNTTTENQNLFYNISNPNKYQNETQDYANDSASWLAIRQNNVNLSATTNEVAYNFTYTTNKTAGLASGMIINKVNINSSSDYILELQLNGASVIRGYASGQMDATKYVATNTFQSTWTNPGTTGAVVVGNTVTNTGSQEWIRIIPTYNQAASVANNTDLLINRQELSVGTGRQRLIDAQANNQSMFSADNRGNVLISRTLGINTTIASEYLQLGSGVNSYCFRISTYTYLCSEYSSGKMLLGNNMKVNTTAQTSQGFITANQAATIGASGLLFTQTDISHYVLPLNTTAGTSITSNSTWKIMNENITDIQMFNNNVVFKSSGNVGIGTSSPTQKLDVNGSINISSTTGILYSPQICLAGSCQTSWPTGADGTGGWTNNSQNTTTAFNVGIGTVSPLQKLDVNGTIGLSGNLSHSESGNFLIENKVQDKDIVFNLNYSGNSSEVLRMNGTDSSLSLGMGAVSMIVDSQGRVGIGTLTPSEKLHVAGNGNFTGIIYATNLSQTAAVSCALSTDSKGDIICTSDERLKNIKSNYTQGLEVISKINPVKYSFKNEEYIHVGFIAQNVKEVLPEATPLQTNGYLGLDDKAIVAALVNSVKELKEQNNQLKKIICLDHPDEKICANQN